MAVDGEWQQSFQTRFILLSEITDKEGRYTLVKGTIDQNDVTLVNAYRPTEEDKLFLKKKKY